jgi:DNA-dependent RNA polymerase auxiliary subunit epsilon
MFNNRTNIKYHWEKQHSTTGPTSKTTERNNIQQQDQHQRPLRETTFNNRNNIIRPQRVHNVQQQDQHQTPLRETTFNYRTNIKHHWEKQHSTTGPTSKTTERNNIQQQDQHQRPLRETTFNRVIDITTDIKGDKGQTFNNVFNTYITWDQEDINFFLF